jgi:hypothetical protein
MRVKYKKIYIFKKISPILVSMEQEERDLRLEDIELECVVLVFCPEHPHLDKMVCPPAASVREGSIPVLYTRQARL